VVFFESEVTVKLTIADLIRRDGREPGGYGKSPWVEIAPGIYKSTSARIPAGWTILAGKTA
jgi:hypothetical protein